MNFCITISEVDWALTKDFFSIIGTVGALLIGFLGLSTWRRQLRGGGEYDLAKRAILKSYEVQEALQAVRNPVLFLSKDEVEAGRRLQEQQRVYDERMSKVYAKWAELKVICLEARVIWSDLPYSCFEDLYSCVSELKGAVWMHFWLQGAYAGPETTVDASPERITENDKIIYYISERDEFSVRISSAIQSVERFFAPKVRGKRRFW